MKIQVYEPNERSEALSHEDDKSSLLMHYVYNVYSQDAQDKVKG